MTQGIAQYRLKTIFNRPIPGSFYTGELQKVIVTEDQTYTIDKILETKGKGANKMCFVSWIGFGNEYNTWVKQADVINYK